MAKLFAPPKPKPVTLPKPKPPVPMPGEDDEAMRRAKRRKIADMQRQSGPRSVLLAGGYMGDDSQAPTRKTLG